MLMSPNKGETAVNGCHCQSDMVLRMLKVMGIPRSLYVCFCAVILVLVSLLNRTVERGGRQNGCSAVVLTKYQGFFWLLQNDLLNEDEVRGIFFQTKLLSSLLHKVCRLLSLFFITTLIFNYIF